MAFEVPVGLLARCGALLLVTIVCTTACGSDPSGPGDATPAPLAEAEPPATLGEAIAALRRLIPAEELEQMRSGSEENMLAYHHGLGTSMRNSWGLWSDGPLARDFNRLGVHHPDDMSGIILDSLWRDLNGQPLRVEEQVAHYKEYWRLHAYPDDAVCPTHGAALRFVSSSNASDAVVYEARCSSHAETWYWQVDRGFYQGQ